MSSLIKREKEAIVDKKDGNRRNAKKFSIKKNHSDIRNFLTRQLP